MKYILTILSFFAAQLFAKSSDTLTIDQSLHAVVAPEGVAYQWYLNGVKVNGATNKTMPVQGIGSYEVEVYSMNGDTLKLASSLALSATGAVIKIYIIGDSTVCNYPASGYPQTGWGQLLPLYFNTSNISITNNAIGGRSSRSFYKQGRWTPIKTALVAGDYVFIQFGHNDRDFTDTSRYTSVADYKSYLTMYCNDAKAKGAIPVLVSPMVLNAWTGTTMRNVFTESGNNYRGAMLEVANALNVAFIDLNMKSWNLYKTYSAAYNSRFLYKGFIAGEYANYPTGITDGTHFQEMGSHSHCKMITEGIVELSSRADMANLINNMKPLYTIGISVNPTGADDMTTKTSMYPQGVKVTLKTIPKTTSTFQKWNNASGIQISAATLTTLTSGTASTSYSAIYQGATTTCIATATAGGAVSFCQGGSVILTASNGSSYVWKNGTTQVGTSNTYTATISGSYTVDITNAAGCKATSPPITVTVNTPTKWYADTDADSKGDPNTSVMACTQPMGYVVDNTDLCPSDANKIAAGNCGCGKTETSCVDCNNVVNGTAVLDNCSRCVAGTTGKVACTAVGEAETDACSFDGIQETTNAGFKGTAYINVNNVVGSSIVFMVNATNAGAATLSFRYANGGTADRPAQIILNGTTLANNLSFPATGAFITYKTVDVSLTLLKGLNTLKLASTTAEGLANIDQIGYVSTGVSKGNCVVTAVEDISRFDEVIIYPNPSKETFSIKLPFESDLEILDSKGNLVAIYKNILDVEIGKNLSAGLYFVKTIKGICKIVKE